VVAPGHEEVEERAVRTAARRAAAVAAERRVRRAAREHVGGDGRERLRRGRGVGVARRRRHDAGERQAGQHVEPPLLCQPVHQPPRALEARRR
jgi:hypothetical protein